jgi:hypothetical protein
MAQLGVFTWYFMTHVERYLQALVPWMAAVVFAAVWLAWREGLAVRIPVAALVLLQAIWGGDAIFFRAHAMLRETPMVAAARLMESGFRRDWKARERVAGQFQDIGDALPEGSRILLHDYNGRLGLKHAVVVDKPRYQGRIRYGLMDSPTQVHELYKSLGITHVVWRKASTHYDSVGGDMLFFSYAANAIEAPRRVGGTLFGPIPDQLPPMKHNDIALYAGCGNTFHRGLFRLRELDVPDGTARNKRGFEDLPRDADGIQKALARASYVVAGKKCRPGIPVPPPGFVLAGHRNAEDLWVRPW